LQFGIAQRDVKSSCIFACCHEIRQVKRPVKERELEEIWLVLTHPSAEPTVGIRSLSLSLSANGEEFAWNSPLIYTERFQSLQPQQVKNSNEKKSRGAMQRQRNRTLVSREKDAPRPELFKTMY
jgi:hypothetical protein